MQVETLGEVPNWTTGFHRTLAYRLGPYSGYHGSERTRLLLDYLSKREASLARTVHDTKLLVEDKTLATWCYEYFETNEIVHGIEPVDVFSDLVSKHILDIVSQQHNQIIDLYRYLYSRATVPETKSLLGALLEFEQHETMHTKQCTPNNANDTGYQSTAGYLTKLVWERTQLNFIRMRGSICSEQN